MLRDILLRDGCDSHKIPKADGKEFKPQDYGRELEKGKLITKPKQLAGADREGFKPSGEATRQGGRLVFQHFR